MLVDVVMPVYNTNDEIHHLTEMAIDSLCQAGDINLIIVDNGSTFAKGYLRKISDIYIRNETNLGYPKAVNQGLKRATSKMICIANNDIRVPKNVFYLGSELLRGSKIGSIHYKMIPYTSNFTFGDKVWRTGKERWCTSSFFLIKREALPSRNFECNKTEENYDENFGMGGYDDWDFWHRVRHKNKWQTIYTNMSYYQHYGSWTLSKIPEIEKSEKNREYFKKKHGEYPEDIWNRLYSEQMKADYLQGFE